MTEPLGREEDGAPGWPLGGLPLTLPDAKELGSLQGPPGPHSKVSCTLVVGAQPCPPHPYPELHGLCAGAGPGVLKEQPPARVTAPRGWRTDRASRSHRLSLLCHEQAWRGHLAP